MYNYEIENIPPSVHVVQLVDREVLVKNPQPDQ